MQVSMFVRTHLFGDNVGNFGDSMTRARGCDDEEEVAQFCLVIIPPPLFKCVKRYLLTPLVNFSFFECYFIDDDVSI